MKDLDTRFAEIERRVAALVSDNARLRAQVAALQTELEHARVDAEELQGLQGKRLQIRERIEKVLQSLETIGEKGV